MRVIFGFNGGEEVPDDLSINRYKEVVYEEQSYAPPKEILKELKKLEQEIMQDLYELEAML